MFRLIIFCLFLVCLSCGSENQQPFISGNYELFMGVDVGDRSCEDGTFSASISLRSSNLAEKQPNGVRIMHWDFNADIWTDIETLELGIGDMQYYALDLTNLGGCESQGLSIVFLPLARGAYGNPEFLTFESGASDGGSSSYSFETDTNSVTFRCPFALSDEAQVRIYNFRTREVGPSIELAQEVAADMQHPNNNIWSGTTGVLRPSQDVLIFQAMSDGDVVCSFLL